jgi:hypothetical protein
MISPSAFGFRMALIAVNLMMLRWVCSFTLEWRNWQTHGTQKPKKRISRIKELALSIPYLALRDTRVSHVSLRTRTTTDRNQSSAARFENGSVRSKYLDQAPARMSLRSAPSMPCEGRSPC